MTRSRFTSEEVITAYQETGSVWKAGKKLGIGGQTVHERLTALGYKLAASSWTNEELDELKNLVGHLSTAEIAHRLGRPYNGVAIKISRLGIGIGSGGRAPKKLKASKGQNYIKAKIVEYKDEMESLNMRPTPYAKMKGLKPETLITSLQVYHPEWYEAYSEKYASHPKRNCTYCSKEFWPVNGKQSFCTRKCSDDSRVDQSYFGGRRRETIGLAEKKCQLCGRENIKGLSSHHMKGKENDPDNDYLIALCPGCHQIVTILGGRNFAATPEIWEALIQLVLIRKNGHNPDAKGFYVYVEIDSLNDDEIEELFE
jgi:hypothetical protein